MKTETKSESKRCPTSRPLENNLRKLGTCIRNEIKELRVNAPNQEKMN
jgi:hypothetical protein